MYLLTQCLNQKITCLGLITPLLSLIATIILSIIGLPRLRTYLVSDLEQGRNQLFKERSIEADGIGFGKIVNVIAENITRSEIEPYTHQDEYQLPENLFENIVKVRIRKNPNPGDIGEQVLVKHGNPKHGELPLYDVGSPVAVSNWINTKIESIQYRIIVKYGFPLLLLSFALQTLTYWYANII